MRLLVVEDNHDVASLLFQALSGEGHEVTLASDGEEALALLGRRDYDGVLLDVTLKELSGVDVLRRLRQTDRQMPVVIITGQASAKQLAEARRLGVSGVIQKPYVLKNLGEALRAVSESR
jgi:DNA-binding response OmpR family regulator